MHDIFGTRDVARRAPRSSDLAIQALADVADDQALGALTDTQRKIQSEQLLDARRETSLTFETGLVARFEHDLRPVHCHLLESPEGVTRNGGALTNGLASLGTTRQGTEQAPGPHLVFEWCARHELHQCVPHFRAHERSAKKSSIGDNSPGRGRTWSASMP